MNQGEGKAEVSLSNEFFKKLNQQIVQKDNLIKLLQLQIKNLKAQIGEFETKGGAGSGDSGELGKQLETKKSEIKALKDELAHDRDQLNEAMGQKEAQIKSLNETVEKFKRELEKASAGGAPAADSAKVLELQAEVDDYSRRFAELGQKQLTEAAEAAAREAELVGLQNQLAELDAIKQVAAEAESLKAQLADIEELRARAGEADALRVKVTELEAQMVPSADVESLRAKVAGIPALEEKLRVLGRELAQARSAPVVEDHSQRVLELEQDIATLKELLSEKDQQIVAQLSGVAVAGPDPAVMAELDKARADAASAKAELSAAKGKAQSLEADAAAAQSLRAQLAAAEAASQKSQTDAGTWASAKAELQAQLAGKTAEAVAAVAKAADLEGQLEKALDSAGDEELLLALQTENKRLAIDLVALQTKVNQGQSEILELQNSLSAAQNATARGPIDMASQADVEKLTQQVADQLLAIQKNEDRSRQLADAVSLKDQEIVSLRQQLMTSGPRNNEAIPLPSDGEIVSNFIDFFDGLDTFLLKNPNPELQTLHHKLLERLIKPNQIEYLPVIAEEFDNAKHVATDFFRSKRFPEKCIVFEVEKGYRKGEQVVKKPKVWVVQNVFNCQSCSAPQTHEDSRFCFKCGAQLMAPNGLPLDHLPLFEPTVTTFLKFGERMLDKGDVSAARQYLQEGLGLDGNFVPILVRLADVLSMESDFAGALEMLKKASQIKTDPRILEKLRDLEVKNTIFQQARALNLSPARFEELRQLIQK